ncbi:hypothetical protein D9M71_775180 [compost metagenome]
MIVGNRGKILGNAFDRLRLDPGLVAGQPDGLAVPGVGAPLGGQKEVQAFVQVLHPGQHQQAAGKRKRENAPPHAA